MKPALRVVPTPESVETQLRALIRERDRLCGLSAGVDVQIALAGRRYADARGEFMTPRHERLRRELGL